MSGLMSPHEYRYRMARFLSKDIIAAESPGFGGAIAKILGDKYEADYRRCEDVCRMLRNDDKPGEVDHA